MAPVSLCQLEDPQSMAMARHLHGAWKTLGPVSLLKGAVGPGGHPIHEPRASPAVTRP